MKQTTANILRWAYSKPDGNRIGGVSFIANVIHCHYGQKARLLRGLYNVVVAGGEVRAGNTIDQVCINGSIQPMTNLMSYA